MMLGPQVTRKVRIHLGSQSVAQRDVGANKKNCVRKNLNIVVL